MSEVDYSVNWDEMMPPWSFDIGWLVRQPHERLWCKHGFCEIDL